MAAILLALIIPVVVTGALLVLVATPAADSDWAEIRSTAVTFMLLAVATLAVIAEAGNHRRRSGTRKAGQALRSLLDRARGKAAPTRHPIPAGPLAPTPPPVTGGQF